MVLKKYALFNWIYLILGLLLVLLIIYMSCYIHMLNEQITKKEQSLDLLNTKLKNLEEESALCFSGLFNQLKKEWAEEGHLSDEVIASIKAFSMLHSPENTAYFDSVSVQDFSVPRGQLLMALLELDLDKKTWLRLKADVSFSGAVLREVDLKGIDLSSMDLQGVDLTDANLSHACLDNTNMKRANLQRVNMVGASVIKSNLKWADARWANMSHLNGDSTRLDGILLNNARLNNAVLNDASLMWSELRGADLTEVSANRANLKGCDLLRANLTSAKFQKANFNRANLCESIFSNTNIDSAIMINAMVMVKSWIDNIDIAGIEGRDWLMANYILIREGERFKLAKKSKGD